MLDMVMNAVTTPAQRPVCTRLKTDVNRFKVSETEEEEKKTKVTRIVNEKGITTKPLEKTNTHI